MISTEQTRLWAQLQAEFGLKPGTSAYAQAPSAAGMGDDAVVMSILTGDPRRNDVDFTESIVAALPQRLSGKVANMIPLLGMQRRTAVLASSEAADGDTITARVGIRRDGGVEAAIGSTAFFTSRDDIADRRYRLFVLVHLVRQVVETESRVLAELGDAEGRGPFQLVMVLPGGARATLTGYADGWRSHDDLFGPDIPTAAASPDPVIVLDVDQWPSSVDESAELIERFAERISDAFGDGARRFRTQSGVLEPTYA